MLKTRIIPVLLYRDGSIVKGKQFDSWRRVGPVIPAVKVHNMRNVDELIFLDIGATPEGRDPDFDLIAEAADECFMPLTVGGGIRTLEHFREALLAGADKVVVNTAAVEDPSLIERAAHKFGSQCVTVSIDVKDGYVATHCARKRTDNYYRIWAKRAASLGAGEILINGCAQDGMCGGYNLELTRAISGEISTPIIACGGAGTYEHLREGLDAGAHAVAAGAMFQFTEQTPQGAAQYLNDRGYPVRHEHTDNGRDRNAWSSLDAAFA